MPKYSNPRMAATIDNWPSGSKRVTAEFWIESAIGKGERAVRVTTGAPKKLTFARKMRIVDGDDGLTYIAALSSYGHVTIFQRNMQYHKEAFFEDDGDYAEVLKLFDGDAP